MTRRRTVVNRDAEASDIPFGPCCVCGQPGELPNLMMLELRGGEPGKGWGCLLCGLPPDGATAAICRRCIPDDWQPGAPRPGGEVRYACVGYVTDPRRVPIVELVEPWRHDMALHAADDAAAAAFSDAVRDLTGGHPDGDWFEDADGEQHHSGDACEPFTCSACGRRFEHRAPILAWPKTGRGELVPDGGGDVVMHRFCQECAELRLNPRRS